MEKFQAPSIDKEDKKADILEQDQDLREEELEIENQIEVELAEVNQEVVVESSVEELVEENKEEFLEPEIEMKDIEKKESERLSQRRSLENVFTKIDPQDYKNLLKEEVINEELYQNLVKLDREIKSKERPVIESDSKFKKHDRVFNEETIKLRDKQAEAHRIIEKMLSREAIEVEMRRRQAERDVIRIYSQKKNELTEKAGVKPSDKVFPGIDSSLDEAEYVKTEKEWDEMVDNTFNTIKNITEKDLQSLLSRQGNAFNTLSELMDDEKIEDKLLEANKIEKGQARVFKTYRDLAVGKISPETDRDKLATLTPWRSKKARIDYLEAMSRLDNQGTAEMIKYFRDKEEGSEKDGAITRLDDKIKDAQKKDEILRKFAGLKRVEFDFQTKKATPNKLLQAMGIKIGKAEVDKMQKVLDGIMAKNKKKK